MTDWRTYRNENPREIWDLEWLARYLAAKLAIGVRQSQCHSRGREGDRRQGEALAVGGSNFANRPKWRSLFVREVLDGLPPRQGF
jgi:hypothetical protein